MMNRRIGIDFHIVNGIYHGARSHILQLFSRVIEISPDIEFFLFLDSPDTLQNYSAAFTKANVHLIRMPHSNPIKRLCWHLPVLQKKYTLDLFHSQYIIPLPSYVPCIVTIHDILFEKYPQYFPSIFRLRSKLLMRLSARRAMHVFTVSEYSKREIVANYKIDQDKVTVIHNGVDTTKFYPGTSGKEIVKKRNLTSGGYILSVGRLEPRKNYSTLIRAYANFSGITLPLVIIGQRHFGFKDIFDLINRLGLGNKIIILENVGDEELPAIYRHARLFVYPTYAEGFGMPLLEAMASGLPIISSNRTSIPEVVGQAGILIDPGNVDELTSVMRRVLSDAELHMKIKQDALSRVTSFQWQISAKIVRQIYERFA